jgi:soluble lytic murein transglycosylase-like protein
VRLVALIVALSLIVGIAATRARAADTVSPQDGSTASLPQPGAAATARAEFPEILSATDAELYREVFQLQDAGRWADADRRIRRIKDRLLMGHVMAQRYLHPTKYRSRYDELASWLKHYADHPDAAHIHALALRRKPSMATAPAAPRDRFEVSSEYIETGIERPARAGSAAEVRVQRRISGLVRLEHLSEAERYLSQASVVRAIGRDGADRARALIAAGWLRRGDDAKAFRVASVAARRSGARAPRTLWWAGLAAYRLGQFESAIAYFDEMSTARSLSGRDIAAAAFWAGRAALRGGHPERVGIYMDRAARYDRTFYGQIAARIRGTGPRFDWAPPAVDSNDVVAFATQGAGRRMLALMQLGEAERAEAEVRSLRIGTSPKLLRTIIALAETADMPGTSLRAGRVLLRGMDERIDTALYPIPHWIPEGGYQIDRALVYALARQESAFTVRARSSAGARGLLQLMPATARYMADSRKSFSGRHGNSLYDPQFNLALGQKYVGYLLGGDIVSNNLVLMIAAYNGGPGNLAKWQREVKHDSDPLIFIESIPVRETRLFVQRVFENLWIYRARLDQPAPSLDALASGLWPTYVALDGPGLGVAEETR